MYFLTCVLIIHFIVTTMQRYAKITNPIDFPIYVKTLVGTCMECRVTNSTSVIELHQMITKICNVPSERQCIIFAGMILEQHKQFEFLGHVIKSTRYLRDYCIEPEAVLHLVIRRFQTKQLMVTMLISLTRLRLHMSSNAEQLVLHFIQ